MNRGLYESLLTEGLAGGVARLPVGLRGLTAELRNAEAADRLAAHLGNVIERVINSLPENDRAEFGAQLIRRIIASAAGEEDPSIDLPAMPPQVLQAILGIRPDGEPETIEAPLIPLLDTTLLTNAPGEPRVGRQIQAEIASADRIDVVMAFIRRSGITPLREALRRHVQAGRDLRVLTTVFTGSTELEAIEMLLELGGQVKVSYDTTSTRLHAKAWLFHRKSGFSTAYVGSSNLTQHAQVTGLEWNVRLSAARNRAVLEKMAAVFDSYWEQPDFEHFDRERFATTVSAARSAPGTIDLSPVEIRLEPFQERLLEQIELSRARGYHRNLLVAATGTGKTVMAAVDYSRLRRALPRARLLFVAHRAEILEQARKTFAHALRDGNFGEYWVDGQRPDAFEHVFASIQSLSANGLEHVDPEHFDVVIVDEFHHAAAASYERLLNRLRPVELLGLTATPERTDDRPILQWFDDRIAAELRLWDAIDQHRLSPFAYYGIADELDLRQIPWQRGRGYDLTGVTNLITSTDVWARKVLQEFIRHVGDPGGVRTLGFCVSVDHARYMERVFAENGVSAKAVWAATPDGERQQALTDLGAGRLNVLFSVDLFNEGVDIPAVDALLMLRPTDSPVLFIQQLGRGLRKAYGKSVCTVLDFVGQHRREFRYDRRFRALLGGSRASLERQVKEGFPFLPAGCHMQLDRVASERVLRSIRDAVPSNWPQRVAELRTLAMEEPEISLDRFLALSGLDADDVYANNRCWTDLRAAAGLEIAAPGPHERVLLRACGRLTHADDFERLGGWKKLLMQTAAPNVADMDEHGRRLIRMLIAQLFDQVQIKDLSLQSGVELLWQHPNVRSEILELLEVLHSAVTHVADPVPSLASAPLRIHARYTRLEIMAALGVGEGAHAMTWQTGVYFAAEVPADVFAFTLDKTVGAFSPNTRYKDYAINRELIHWESQSVTREDSETGRRYQNHVQMGSQVLLFGRINSTERSFYFLGPATYVSHQGERPMGVIWRLHQPLPGDLFQAFAAAVA